ncbi:O-antigen ligase family protein [Maribacter litopenaei]|uniref:O-antigen ligase family protein n=1 Tax=Maribacter litopenaei TaxID=2976127 RepID=A0ABY5YE03_9FLAO|nr:O-antigen ligase family protein [Maribacter litopenaei]UWX56101.1 O-antigen ligase family protein [Maribacter litopenaei]
MAISYSIKNNILRLTGQGIFTLAGMLTLSRTFIIIWVLINFTAIFKSRKNLLVPLIGGVAFVIIISFTDSRIFAPDRFKALTALFGEGQVKAKSIGNEGRSTTWAIYYDLIFKNPLTGQGYKSFQVMTTKLPGVHNTYLMILGESGLIPFLIFIGTYGYLFRYSIVYFKKEPYLLYILIVVLLNLMASHTFFANYQSIALSVFVYLRIREFNNEKYIFSESQLA